MSDQQNQQSKPTNSDRLKELLGFDAANKNAVSKDVFSEAVAEITKERKEAAKIKAKEQLQQAMALREQMHKAEKEFSSGKAKFEKELGKIINSLVSSLNGKPVEETPAEEKEEKEDAPA